MPAGKIDVFGIVLGSRVDHRVLLGAVGEKEPCLHGYEYVFEALDVRIGYYESGEVRAVTTRNPANSVFGVRVGDRRGDAAAKLGAEGFFHAAGADVYAGNLFSIRLLVNEGGEVFGIKIEKLR